MERLFKVEIPGPAPHPTPGNLLQQGWSGALESISPGDSAVDHTLRGPGSPEHGPRTFSDLYPKNEPTLALTPQISVLICKFYTCNTKSQDIK